MLSELTLQGADKVSTTEGDEEELTKPYTMSVTIQHEKELCELIVRPQDRVETLQLEIQDRWGVAPADQRLFHDGMPVPVDLELNLLGDGAKLLLRLKSQGGGDKSNGRERKRSYKGSSIRAAKL